MQHSFSSNLVKHSSTSNLGKMLLIKVIVIVALTKFNCCSAFIQRPTVISELVQDIIQNENIPSTLLAVTCWSNFDELKSIANFPFLVQFIQLDNFVKLPVDERHNTQWILIDMNCTGSSSFLSNVTKEYFAHPYRWIIADATDESIQNLTFLPDSNVILANIDPSVNGYSLKQGFFLLRKLAVLKFYFII